MVITEGFTIQTQGFGDMVEVTATVAAAIRQAPPTDGTVTVFIPGATAGVTTIEYEPGLVQDFAAMWQRLVPPDIDYQHDRRWGDGNGFAHTRASLLGPSLTVPFHQKKLLLGTWQQVVVVDFDNRPRERQVVLQIIGE